MREIALTDPEGVLLEPEGASTGVLVLSGSSGRIETDRCRMLASHGVAAASIRYFGGPGQPDEARLIPLETFDEVLADLHSRYQRLVVLGTSWGAQAALLLGTLHPEIDAVVAISPTYVSWAGLSQERPQRSSWTLRGEQVPFVPFDDEAIEDAVEESHGELPSFCEAYLSALEKYADRVPAATVPVERIAGDVVLVAGGDDALWPSVLSAEAVRRRRTAHDLETIVVTHPDAGHRVVLPGEPVLPLSPRLAWGGSEAADRELGLRAWPEIAALL
ncbi:Dienelactone hydrolase [Nocardioides sp. YR527]|uniref:alpha/beta fold hydrolase n=1 Tax=Nocardioides sp. YR527 TaxID=1881028 RepID=UPI00088CCD15|nr:alpha/beta fold hydrolase [Nocardioides sp. YR527]SDK87321.1 Dienelactone hydrolase [Nocardioides sp. YR527]